MNLAALRKIAEAATPGPWFARHRDSGNPGNDPSKDESAGLGWEIEGPPEPMRGQFSRGADAHFIATFSPPTVLALLDVVEAARAVSESGRNDWTKAHDTLLAALARLEALDE